MILLQLVVYIFFKGIYIFVINDVYYVFFLREKNKIVLMLFIVMFYFSLFFIEWICLLSVVFLVEDKY